METVATTSSASATTAPPSAPNGEVEQRQATPKRKSVLISALIVLGIIVFLIFLGIHSRTVAERELKQNTREAAIPTVRVTRPMGGSASEEIVLPGNTEAFTDTPIYARTSGYLKKWFVDIGGHVRKGELLATIETPELDQQLMQAQADLKSAQANMELAETTSIRWQALLAKHAVSKQETDQAVSDYAAKQATYAASEANVRRLQQLQNYEQVIAPFDGVITARNTDIGDLITAGSGSASTMAPRELFHMAAMEKLRIFVAVPEVYAERIENGAKVEITRDSNPTQPITGTIVRNASAIDQTSRTLNIEVDIDNVKGQVLPGAYVFVHIKLPGGRRALTIPSNALIFRAQGPQVGVVRDGRVQLTSITIGHDYGSTLEVTSGLTPEDQIVLDPSDSLTSGTRVEVIQNSAKEAGE
jgi:RND family efflux transporter MFP subunit